MQSLPFESGGPKWWKSSHQQIESELRQGRWNHCAVYEEELQRLLPLEAKDRQAKIAELAKTYGFRLRFYRKGLCAIFGNWPRSDFTDGSDARLRNPSKQRSSRRLRDAPQRVTRCCDSRLQ